MAIVINGSGTVTGISVGGLPDGIVDAGTLATDSVDSAELIAGGVDDAHLATGISASKLTGSLPAISGASLTGISGGKVLQVKQAYWHPSSVVTITNQQWITDLDVVITPTSASSKFLTFVTFGMLRQDVQDSNIEVRYYRDSTVIDGGSYGLMYANYEGSNFSKQYSPYSFTFPHQETAGSTSSRTYKIRFNTSGNWVFHNGATNSHIIMEYEV